MLLGEQTQVASCLCLSLPGLQQADQVVVLMEVLLDDSDCVLILSFRPSACTQFHLFGRVQEIDLSSQSFFSVRRLQRDICVEVLTLHFGSVYSIAPRSQLLVIVHISARKGKDSIISSNRLAKFLGMERKQLWIWPHHQGQLEFFFRKIRDVVVCSDLFPSNEIHMKKLNMTRARKCQVPYLLISVFNFF